MNPIDDILHTLIIAPPDQIDGSMIPRLEALLPMPLAERPAAMKAILDECAHAALASDFAMMAMDMVWKHMQKEAGQ